MARPGPAAAGLKPFQNTAAAKNSRLVESRASVWIGVKKLISVRFKKSLRLCVKNVSG
jgi:hypothetical protein